MKRIPVALLVLPLLTAACGGRASDPGATSGGPEVIAAFYPLAFAAGEVAGEHATVTNLSPPGVEPHDLELAPDQVRTLSDADLVVYLGEGFQRAVEDLVGQLDDTPALDGLAGQDDADDDHGDEDDAHGDEDDHSDEGDDDDDHSDEEESTEEGHDHELEVGATDPHVWLDPTRLAAIGDAVADHLSEIDPDNADSYRDNAETLGDKLASLDDDYDSALEECNRRELVVSHEAFGYLTDRYDLQQVGVSGLDPETEPSPGRVAEVAEYAEEHGVTTIFFEEQVSPDIAEVIASEIEAGTEVLDPLEFPPDDGNDYFDVMQNNLDAITAALGCT